MCLSACLPAFCPASLLEADWAAWGAWVESRAAWLAGGVARSMRRAGSLRYAVTGSRDEPHTYLSLAYESRDLCPVLGLSVRRIALAVLLASHGVRLSVRGSCAVRLPLTVGQMAACCPWHVVRPLWGVPARGRVRFSQTESQFHGTWMGRGIIAMLLAALCYQTAHSEHSHT